MKPARVIVATLLWVALLFFGAAFAAGGEAKWFGQLLSAFNAAVFATLWTIDR